MSTIWPVLPKTRLGKNPLVDNTIFNPTPFGSGGSGLGMAVDKQNNLYLWNNFTKTIFKMYGISNTITAQIAYPTGYTTNWQINDITWNHSTNRLCMVMGWTGGGLPSYRALHHWVELSGFSTTVAYAVEMPWVSSLGVWLSGVRSANVDVQRNLLVCNATAYDGHYHNWILIYNYPTMTKYQNHWHGQFPISSNQPRFTFIGDEDNTRIWLANDTVDDHDLREYNYTQINGTGYCSTLSNIDFTIRTIGKYGIVLDMYDDMWMMGSQTSSPYWNQIRGYNGISAIRR